MSQVAPESVGSKKIDSYEIGWYIESADEDIYGPVSLQSLRRFLEDKTITPNTLVRHCTQPEARPAADQPAIMEQLNLDTKGSTVGDMLADAWPRKNRDRLALAEGSVPCAWHKRPATLLCVRCHAPYCDKCRAKPFKKQFFLCRRCQAGMYNRRALAWVIDNLILGFAPLLFALVLVAVIGEGTIAVVIVSIVQVITLILFFLRDSLFRGAWVGKRMLGLRVVQAQDGKTPLTNVQGFVRLLSLMIPLFNLVDLSVPFRDPLLRRYGDRWAGTRVLDTERKLAKARDKIARRLIKKGVQPVPVVGMTMDGLARIV